MSEARHRVAIIGCGGHGEYVARGYHAFPETEIVAIAEPNPDTRTEMGERFGVRALYPDVHALLEEDVPDLAVAVTPSRYYKEIVLACAEAGVKGVSTDKPMAAVLADADEMVEVCRQRGVVYSGGTMQRANHEVQEAARRIRAGTYGDLTGACVHRLGSEVSGGGCQVISVLRLLTDAEIVEVRAWARPDGNMAPDMLTTDRDVGWVFSGILRLSNGMQCPAFGSAHGGVDVWNEEALIRWDWDRPEIFQGYGADGGRQRVDPGYAPQPWSQFVSSQSGSAYSFMRAVETGGEPWVSGHDMRQALEVAIALMLSYRRGTVPIPLPLEDRSLALYPSPFRWEGRAGVAMPRPLW